MTTEQLRAKLEESAAKVVVGGLYQHYKGGIYKVLAISIREETLEVDVIYVNQETGITFNRPLNDFLELLTVDEQKVRRFQQIEG